MFDRTNNNNVKATDNSYLAKDGRSEWSDSPQIVRKKADSNEPKKDNTAKIVVAVLFVAIIVVIAIIAFLFFQGRKNSKELLKKAFTATFEESEEYLSNVWNLEQYEGMFAGTDYTMEADLDVTGGIDVNMLMQKKEDTFGFDVDVRTMDITVGVQGYLDKQEIRVAIPGMLDYVFLINRETLSEDVWNLVDIGMLDEQTAEQIILVNEGWSENNVISAEAVKMFGRAVQASWTELYNKSAIKKLKETKRLRINSGDRDCTGYHLAVTFGDAADLIEKIEALYTENGEFRAILEAGLMTQGYSEGDLTDVYSEFNSELDGFLAYLRENIQETINLEIYLYDGRIAQVYTEVNGVEVGWNVEGGNFPLENTSFIINDGGSELKLQRSGSMEDGEHQAKYIISNGYEEVGVDVRYTTETGKFYYDFLENGYSMLFTSGSLKKADDSALELTIDAFNYKETSLFDGTITISDQSGEIERPEGVEKEVFFMNQADWENVIYEILIRFYLSQSFG